MVRDRSLTKREFVGLLGASRIADGNSGSVGQRGPERQRFISRRLGLSVQGESRR